MKLLLTFIHKSFYLRHKEIFELLQDLTLTVRQQSMNDGVFNTRF